MTPLPIETPAGPVTLRPEEERDQAFRFALFCDSRPPEWSQVRLAPELRESLMRHQFTAQTVGYRQAFPAARFDIVERGGDPIGRIVVDRTADAVHIVDQAIVPAWRGRGIGTAIMGTLMAEAAARDARVELEVGDGNDPSLRLYLRLGFAPVETVPLYIRLVWHPAPAGAGGAPP